MIALARAALRGEPTSLTMLARSDGAPTIAFLVTVGRAAGDLLLPLREGRNFIGRGVANERPFGAMPAPYPVEQCQWFITCSDRQAHISDASSTNLSTLIRGEQHTLIAHPNTPGVVHQHALQEGDVLRSCYATFVFAWRRP
jgi:hypothetical protein